MNVNNWSDKDLGYEQITSLSSATALTIPTGCQRIIITPETQAVRWRADGTDPTATVGYPLAVGAEIEFTVGNLTTIKFIEQAASAKLNVYYFG